jgi:hypothetical protein
MITKMIIRRMKPEGKNAATITRLGSAASLTRLPCIVSGLLGARVITNTKKKMLMGNCYNATKRRKKHTGKEDAYLIVQKLLALLDPMLKSKR